MDYFPPSERVLEQFRSLERHRRQMDNLLGRGPIDTLLEFERNRRQMEDLIGGGPVQRMLEQEQHLQNLMHALGDDHLTRAYGAVQAVLTQQPVLDFIDRITENGRLLAQLESVPQRFVEEIKRTEDAIRLSAGVLDQQDGLQCIESFIRKIKADLDDGAEEDWEAASGIVNELLSGFPQEAPDGDVDAWCNRALSRIAEIAKTHPKWASMVRFLCSVVLVFVLHKCVLDPIWAILSMSVSELLEQHDPEDGEFDLSQYRAVVTQTEVRNAASDHAEQCDALEPMRLVLVLEEHEGWFFIRYAGDDGALPDGWVCSDHLREIFVAEE